MSRGGPPCWGPGLPGPDLSFLPGRRKGFPLLSSVCDNKSCHIESHLGHLKRKCLTVSLAVPHWQRSESVALMPCRYPLSLDMPVRSWLSTAASFRRRVSYSFLMCAPGSAQSISLENRPTRTVLRATVLVSPPLWLTHFSARSL